MKQLRELPSDEFGKQQLAPEVSGRITRRRRRRILGFVVCLISATLSLACIYLGIVSAEYNGTFGWLENVGIVGCVLFGLSAVEFYQAAAALEPKPPHD